MSSLQSAFSAARETRRDLGELDPQLVALAGRGLDALPAATKGRLLTSYFQMSGNARRGLEQTYRSGRQQINAYWAHVRVGEVLKDDEMRSQFVMRNLPAFLVGAAVGVGLWELKKAIS